MTDEPTTSCHYWPSVILAITPGQVRFAPLATQGRLQTA
eukprot:CAMPEP_0171079330 /NCGR_PEP_ID=MMETSP0766_2-20121228/15193_1 /TAXON_ID=439317 /ORGANISM="Gambierdiscus australes, Strain CAWD 149" /LENGTH=38 /DNA_ID= /DNA_START= /DNA_END= /DNA_ORIENTATION=